MQAVVDLARLQQRGGTRSNAQGGLIPELAKFADPILGRVARDDGSGHRADGSADNPIWTIALPMQSLIGSGVIGAHRVSAREHEHEILRRSGPVLVGGHAGHPRTTDADFPGKPEPRGRWVVTG